MSAHAGAMLASALALNFSLSLSHCFLPVLSEIYLEGKDGVLFYLGVQIRFTSECKSILPQSANPFYLRVQIC